jgi:hypothetical protein
LDASNLKHLARQGDASLRNTTRVCKRCYALKYINIILS